MKGGDSPLEPSTSGSWGKIRGLSPLEKIAVKPDVSTGIPLKPVRPA